MFPFKRTHIESDYRNRQELQTKEGFISLQSPHPLFLFLFCAEHSAVPLPRKDNHHSCLLFCARPTSFLNLKRVKCSSFLQRTIFYFRDKAFHAIS